MTRRTWLLVGVAFALAVAAGLSPCFDNGITDYSATAVLPVKEYAAINDPLPERPPGVVSHAVQALKHRFERVAEPPPDRAPPAPPRFLEPEEGRVIELPRNPQTNAFQPFFEVPGLVFTGTAEAGSLVTLASARGMPLGGGRADANGRWVAKLFSYPMVAEFGLAPVLTVTATATDAAGNVSAPSSMRVSTHTAPSP
jgi:hypothetical protein